MFKAVNTALRVNWSEQCLNILVSPALSELLDGIVHVMTVGFVVCIFLGKNLLVYLIDFFLFRLVVLVFLTFPEIVEYLHYRMNSSGNCIICKSVGF